MAGIAVVPLNRNVPGRHGLIATTAMAVAAATAYRTVFHIDLRKAGGHMTVVTGIVRLDMTGRFAGGEAAIVATDAVPRRTAEHSCLVTGAAGDGLVSTGKDKASGEVIEIRCDRDGTGDTVQQAAQQQDNKMNAGEFDHVGT